MAYFGVTPRHVQGLFLTLVRDHSWYLGGHMGFQIFNLGKLCTSLTSCTGSLAPLTWGFKPCHPDLKFALQWVCRQFSETHDISYGQRNLKGTLTHSHMVTADVLRSFIVPYFLPLLTNMFLYQVYFNN